MHPNIEFNPAAFKHGISEADIQRAVDTFVFEEPMDGFDNKYLLLGFDTKGTLLEVMYNFIDEQSINVFHAMPCRKAFYGFL